MRCHLIQTWGVRFLLLLAAFTAIEGCGDEGEEGLVASSPVVINEISCHGTDWVELFNRSKTETISLAGWMLSEKPDNPDHRYFIESGAEIEPQGFFVVQEGNETVNGLTFGFKCAVETAYLYNADSALVSKVPIGPAPEEAAWGQVPDGEGEWMETEPTKGTSNISFLPQ